MNFNQKVWNLTKKIPEGKVTTYKEIAKALVDASKRGVKVMAVLDKSNETGKYSAATFLVNANIPTLIDDKHAIAHNKVIHKTIP